jgi:glycine/D-amino acid oxidase-like deaminating enzyme
VKRPRPRLAVVGGDEQARPSRYDVIVVGGGILGVAAAYELAVRGRRVVLLEQDLLASAATGTSFCWLNATSKTDDESYHRLNAAGLAHYRDIATAWGERSIGLWANGSLHWSGAGAEADTLQLDTMTATLARWNYGTLPLGRDALVDFEPRIAFPDDARGFLATPDGWVEAARLVRFLASQATELGAVVIEKCRVTGIATEAGRVAGVECDGREFRARQIVVAAGIATPALVALATRSLKWRLPVRSVPGLLVETPPSPWRWVRRVTYFPGAHGLHARPTVAGGLQLGADDTDAAVAEGDERAATTAMAELLRRFAGFCPGFEVEELVVTASPRVGFRPMPVDGRPIVGPIVECPGLYVMVTHSGQTLGPLLGRLVAQEIVEEKVPGLLSPYRPNRFAPADASTKVQT